MKEIKLIINNNTLAEYEKYYFKQHPRATKKPIYLLGGFGGEAALISKSVISRETIIKSIRDDTYESLNNGLNKEENMRLLLSTNVFEIIRLIISGMKKVIKPKE